MLDDLKRQVCDANLELVRQGLVVLTWGNASAIDRARGLVVIKPSGVSYDNMQPNDMAVLDLAGRTIQGRLRPSSDTATHLALYREWRDIGGIVHTHSVHATMFAQARRPIPCYGTTANQNNRRICIHRDSAEGSLPAGEKGGMLCARIERAQHTVPLSLRPPFFQGSDSFHSEFVVVSHSNHIAILKGHHILRGVAQRLYQHLCRVLPQPWWWPPHLCGGL